MNRAIIASFIQGFIILFVLLYIVPLAVTIAADIHQLQKEWSRCENEIHETTH